MVARRILTLHPGPALCIGEEPLPAPAPGEAEVAVEAVLLAGFREDSPPPAVLGGKWGTRPVVALGPPADRVILPVEKLWTVPPGVEQDTALLLPLLGAVHRGIRALHLSPGARVLVTGPGLPAAVAALLARSLAGASVERVRSGDFPAGSFDAFVDATGDPALWGPAMSRMRVAGRVLLLLPPGPCRPPFDVYPQVHRRSLRLLARRWTPPEGWCSEPETASLLALARKERRELEKEVHEATLSPGQPVAPDPEGRALRLRWPVV